LANQILVRSLGPNNDPLWGQGSQNFIADILALEQLLATRFRLFQGEWFANTADGTPYWQNILAQPIGNNTQAINLLLTQRALNTPFVTGVVNVGSTFNPTTGNFTFNIAVQTSLGAIVNISNFPTPPSQGLPS